MTDLDALAYTAEHEWIAPDGPLAADAVVTVGITDYAAGRLGDVVYVDLPEVGTATTAGQIAGEIESTKSVGELYAPVTGTVVAVNAAAVDDPSLVNADPFGDGWLVRIRLSGPAPDGLLDRAAYVALTGGAE